MIRRHLMALRLALMLVDAGTSMLVFLLVSLIRYGDGDSADAWRRLGIDIRLAAALFGVVWVVALWSGGLYRMQVRWRLLTEARDIARTTLVVMVLALSTLFLVHLGNVSRLFLVLLFVTQPVVTLAGRAILRFGFGTLRRRGYNTHFMLIAGTGTLAENFANRVEDRSALGIQVIGHLSVPGEPDEFVSRPILGTLEEIGAIFQSRTVDEVAVCLPLTAAHWLDPVTRLAADEGKTVRIPLERVAQKVSIAHEEEFEGFLVGSLVRNGQGELGLVAKRLIDIAGAAVGLVVLSPLLLVTALVLRLREGSPVLFRQARVGLHGRPFTVYKFRTMVPDAEARYAEIAKLSDTRGAAFKMANDPRVTPLGRFLRTASLDELPQLWNVLRGEMSLVGPRPAPPREVEGYDIWHRRRLSAKPGITGLWQIEARFDEDFDDRAQLDLRYIDNWSLALDFKILVRTIPAVFVRPGR
ncbi:MAG: sugar transferase [Acidimicrobiales bacterium]|nr:sugar transferase [Acidimicrobiales bacterium]